MNQKKMYIKKQDKKRINENLKDIELKELLTKITLIYNEVEYSLFRNIITNEKIRPDGRKIDEIRPLSCEVAVLPRVHGSAIFTRGRTQVMSVTTLGMLSEEQILDGLDEEESEEVLSQGYNGYEFEANSNMSNCICLLSSDPIVSRRELSKEEFDNIELYDGFDHKQYDDIYD